MLGETIHAAWGAFEAAELRASTDQLRAVKAKRAERQARREREKQVGIAQQKELDMKRVSKVSSVKDYVIAQRWKRRLAVIDREDQVWAQWCALRDDLARERAVWGLSNPDPLLMWTLDLTEGPFRMRKVFAPHPRFYERYPLVADPANVGDGGKDPASFHTAKYYARLGRTRSVSATSNPRASGTFSAPTIVVVDEAETAAAIAVAAAARGGASTGDGGANGEGVVDLEDDAANLDETTDHLDSTTGASSSNDDDRAGKNRRKSKSGKGRAVDDGSESDDGSDAADAEEYDIVDMGGDDLRPTDPRGAEERTDRKILRRLEAGDTISYMYNCQRVNGLDAIDGLFLICAANVYLISNYLIVDGRVEDVSLASGDQTDGGSGNGGGAGTGGVANDPDNAHTGHVMFKWAFEDLREVHKRRYLLQQVALEIFSTDGRNHLLVFDMMRDEVYGKIQGCISSGPLANLISTGPQVGESEVQHQRRTIRVWSKSMLQRWQAGDISNFQYLMHLNTLAGSVCLFVVCLFVCLFVFWRALVEVERFERVR